MYSQKRMIAPGPSAYDYNVRTLVLIIQGISGNNNGDAEIFGIPIIHAIKGSGLVGDQTSLDSIKHQ